MFSNKILLVLANTRTQLPRSQLQYIKELGTGYFGKVGASHVVLKNL